MTRVAVQTPPGTGAIATIEVAGERAWEFARKLFRPAGRPLPEVPEVHGFRFGRIGEGTGDEGILAATGRDTVEIHCHGGRRVVQWIVEQFLNLGCIEGDAEHDSQIVKLMQRAPTHRTASILLDQLHGAFDRAIESILASSQLAGLTELASYVPIGRHLVAPWKVAVAGAPNVGKSSLVNALAGYQRAVVSEVAGTTRDAVAVLLALDGWPVELIDTAGLREASGLEAKGIERTRGVLAEADLVLWVIDSSRPGIAEVSSSKSDLVVWNKCDLVPYSTGLAVSAKNGAGIPDLVSEIVSRLVPQPPLPGAAVPCTLELADAVEAAYSALLSGNISEGARLLRDSSTSG